MTKTSLRVIDTERLRDAMQRNGFDMTRLAANVQVSREFISKLIARKRNCRPQIADAIAAELGQPTTIFFTSATSEDSDNKESEMPVQSARIDDPYLYIEDVAELARMELATLRYYRAMGKGPDFFSMAGKGGRLRIRLSKARAWIERYENGDLGRPETPAP